MKKIIIVLTLILIFGLSGCSKIKAYQKSFFDDDSKIISQGDSYTFNNKIGNHTKSKTDFDFGGFSGKYTVYTLTTSTEISYQFEYDITIDSGKFKLVFVNAEDKIELITDTTAKGNASVTLKDGKNRIIMLGDESKGSILLNMTEPDGVNINT